MVQEPEGMRAALEELAKDLPPATHHRKKFLTQPTRRTSMDTITVKFRNAEEAAACDLTRIGNVAAASSDGLTVRLEDVDLAEWGASSEPEDILRGAIGAGLAACGVWADVS